MENKVNVIKEFTDWADEFTSIRRQIHANPELGFEELCTSNLVAQKLTEWGYQVHRRIGKTGVVGQLKLGNGERTIGLRADMDALPIQENTELTYASNNSGKMHACGHDGHTTTLLAVAKYFAVKRNFSGTLNLFFQPAEEGLGGAPAMIMDGLFERFPCDGVYSWHNMPTLPDNSIYVKDGTVMASSDRLTIILQGQGGHAASPDTSRDPVVAGASIVSALQTVVSRNISPLESAVVTVGAFLAGNDGSFNIIPDSAKILLSVRTLSHETRTIVLNRIQEIVEHQAKSFNVTADVKILQISPPTVNSKAETSLAQQAALNIFGKQNCHFDFPPAMGSEDFAYMLEKNPGCFAFISNGQNSAVIHNPSYNFNDAIIPAAASYLAEIVKIYLVE